MGDETGYFDLLDWLEEQQSVRPQQFFERMKTAFKLSHVLYVDATPSPGGVIVHALHHTLDLRATQTISTMGRVRLEALLRAALGIVKPFDWSTLRSLEPAADYFHSLSRQSGLPTEGVCYPLPSRNGRAALLAIGKDATPREWPQFRRLHDRDIHALGTHFHAAMLERRASAFGLSTEPPLLTRRELETLRWAAAGKSYWEIAVILGISERTVRYFMSNARRKLNVVTNTQAVAEALCHGILSRV
jgi:DNA-binding HTH domain-containing proteins